MLLVDANILLYAVNSDSPRHAAARSWWETALAGDEPVGLSWSVLLAFLRVSTSRRVFERPLSADHALALVDEWLAQPAVRIVQATDRHWRLLRDLLNEVGAAGNLTSDAHLAALAIEHGARLCSTDGDFARFRSLRWENPLSA